MARAREICSKFNFSFLPSSCFFWTGMKHEERVTGGDSSTSFAVDAVRRFGSQLDSFQEKQEFATTTSTEESEDKKSSSAEVLDVTHCTSLHSTKQLQVALHISGQDDAIGLAKVTFAAYGIVLERLLKDAERVNDQAWFWTQIEEDAGRTILYLVQSEFVQFFRGK